MTDTSDSTAGGPRLRAVPEGDDRERLTCPDCGYVAYENPKVITGAVCTWQDGGEEKVLLCRRAIEPRRGFWTIPAGFLELGETMVEGAVREVWEEARAEIEVGGLLGVFEIPHISQIYIVYHARMTSPAHAPGPESEATELLGWDEMPWDDLAFPSIRWALERYRDEAARPHLATHDRR